MSWIKDKKIKCVVLCAGRGVRVDSESDKPKSMMEAAGKPILKHVIDYWKDFTNDFIFIVHYKKKQIIDYVKKLSINSKFIEQKKLKGIANAVLRAEELTGNKFLLVLGDCWCKGKFLFLDNMEQGVGVWETNNADDIKRSYSILINSFGFIGKVVEKPKILANNLCGMGFYFFTRKVFDYIKITPASSLRNEVEITDVIQKMIDGGEKISPVFFEGYYVNVNLKEDIERIKKNLDENRH